MKILVTGFNGQLGYDVVREGAFRNLEMVGLGIDDLDITNEEAVYETVNRIAPDAVIHCAAYTAVDKAEDEKELCRRVNVDGTAYLAAAAKALNAKFMYISTDYVFDGNGTEAYSSSDLPAPVGYYGLTKFEGEQAVQAILDDWFIVRISWVFGSNGNNFVKTMLRLSENLDQLKIVSDQYGSPTYTYDLSRLLIDMIQTDKYGIYHATNEGVCNWADFAQEIFELTGRDVKVNRITTEEYPTKAVRPKNSRMNKQNLDEHGFSRLPHWEDALKRYLKEIGYEVGK